MSLTPASQPAQPERRRFLQWIGQWSVVAAIVTQLGGVVRAFVPRVLYEPSKKFKLGKPSEYPEGVTFVPMHRLFVARERNQFHVISATCTHLGCTVEWKDKLAEFQCPCHGSKFKADGLPFAGPAPRPLEWYPLSVSGDGFLVVDSGKSVPPTYRFAIA
ncbi:MAG TPA: ubiquinol-cytochrome c reductase iron-sulfur subunit [Candidatus Acidoferrales bacterium]|nr:ubiquinol-cytochrome c reductase iron-sulfur subunit [Candidatus Acidoferrales bacterium]